MKKQEIVRYDSHSNVSPLQVNEKTIEGFKNDPAFDYSENDAEENWWQQFKNWLWNLWSSFWNWLLGDLQNNSLIAFIIKILPYLIIGGIVAFIVWLFFKLNPGANFLKSKEKPAVFYSEEEEIIRSKNIRELIEKALHNKQYRLAVRYYYLLILKKLTDAELIEYEFDKTNTDYIAEITTDTLTLPFKKATNLYDYIWYGNFAVTETDYQKAQRTFQKLEQQIPNCHD
ncbi:DUF4129 domain-containing protein [Marixanthomonas spongiae]|uniref:DUF4129 domain-containing protein n=1 Tax=Marixanthomonas spongiae TaxID=2174845 RepID=UPI00197DC8E1|nr:DUF4129 domain-containing protein [Marixanthomonas spongiae]